MGCTSADEDECLARLVSVLLLPEWPYDVTGWTVCSKASIDHSARTRRLGLERLARVPRAM
eukprot:scaffold150605_cov20-Prasinocladus_malaysianus.AAC.1